MKKLIRAGLLVLVVGCGSTASETSSTSSASSSSSTSTSSSSSTSSGATDCSSATTHIDKAVCAANAFLATLSTTEKATVNLAFTDTVSRTSWSNLPGKQRPGIKVDSFSSDQSKPAALALMSTVLTDAGQTDLAGVMAADDYLGTMQSGYGSANYLIAIFGTPSATGQWSILFGGHHMAYSITYLAGVGYPVPNHLGVEPKASFVQANATYEPLADEGTAMTGIFGSLSDADLSGALLSGQMFSDVLIGPVEYQSGSTAAVKAKYPTGSNRTGVLVSSLSAAQQALVTAAINGWVADFDPAISTQLVADYTSPTAYADTYIAWAGSEASGPDPDVTGTYFRIDGPRLWIEVACQGGIVIKGKTHFHTIYRDKQFDYGGTL